MNQANRRDEKFSQNCFLWERHCRDTVISLLNVGTSTKIGDDRICSKVHKFSEEPSLRKLRYFITNLLNDWNGFLSDFGKADKE
ncbi:hypothetical protein LBK6_05525 [Leptospira borgpetersenii serovar Hardjo]|nr:hypothetical protein LBK6_05525 [Leptospira borgpetersenii serovar Hardjo]AWV69700.1 hypothetical protein B9T54_06025 [Leptospira borgpetersenii serovar Hardjo-bovis]TQE53056.1 hypothetical protein FFZ95_08710 [Leptospira borgpetersenii]AMX61061.1 hypothetical protein LBK9_05465 [Leptospira borgpetersenii serovar Hardjo]AMX64304.1 hypothetical protein LBK30_05490 [Leptospira borgpetersenii serovar Hardjo]